MEKKLFRQSRQGLHSMKTVNWRNVLVDSAVGREAVPEFVNGKRTLRSIRSMCPKGTVILSEVYKLERMGVKRARNAARKALRRLDGAFA